MSADEMRKLINLLEYANRKKILREFEAPSNVIDFTKAKAVDSGRTPMLKYHQPGVAGNVVQFPDSEEARDKLRKKKRILNLIDRNLPLINRLYNEDRVQGSGEINQDDIDAYSIFGKNLGAECISDPKVTVNDIKEYVSPFNKDLKYSNFLIWLDEKFKPVLDKVDKPDYEVSVTTLILSKVLSFGYVNINEELLEVVQLFFSDDSGTVVGFQIGAGELSKETHLFEIKYTFSNLVTISENDLSAIKKVMTTTPELKKYNFKWYARTKELPFE